MSNTALIISAPTGILLFLFFIWKKLREDYSENQVFSFGLIISTFLLFGFLLGNYLHDKLKPSVIFQPDGLWFWLSFMFVIMGFSVGFLTQKGGKDFKPRFYELIEGTAGGFILFLIPIFLVNLFVSKDIKLGATIVFLVSLLFLYQFLNKNYKSFTWYKSGKLGFSGLAILGALFFARALVAIINPNMISFIGKLDAVISILVSFTFFIILYRLSEKI